MMPIFAFVVLSSFFLSSKGGAGEALTQERGNRERKDLRVAKKVSLALRTRGAGPGGDPVRYGCRGFFSPYKARIVPEIAHQTAISPQPKPGLGVIGTGQD